jgi:RES domain-containing protein
MEVHRISDEKYIKDLMGIGAKLFGGRWNPKGLAVLYTSINISLAALEYLAHLDIRTIPLNLKLITLEIPDESIIKFNTSKFNRIIKKKNSMILFKEEGKKWIDSSKSLALEVPSILIQKEKNILINPEHKLIKKVKIKSIEGFKYDKRFFI